MDVQLELSGGEAGVESRPLGGGWIWRGFRGTPATSGSTFWIDPHLTTIQSRRYLMVAFKSPLSTAVENAVDGYGSAWQRLG
jgi:hypothetical protein